MAKINRQDIIDAAITLFNTNSYHATSMQDIARVVQIKKPSLYHHFESKEAILLAILDIGMDRLITNLEQIAASEENCVDKLRDAIHVHARSIADNPAGAGVFLREDRGLGDNYMSRYVEKRDHFERLFRAIIQEGIDQGVFQPTDVSITVHALLGMTNWMTRWYRPSGRLTVEEIADIFCELMINGLCLSEL